MIWLLRPDQPKATEFAPAMDEGTGILPGLPPVASKPVHLTFDGGLMKKSGKIGLPPLVIEKPTWTAPKLPMDMPQGQRPKKR